jgi:formylglycine-generating enzyme required for sulfatase activity
MNVHNWETIKQLAVLMPLLLIGAGCAAPNSAQPDEATVNLVVHHSTVKLIHGEASETEVSQAGNVKARVDDGIQLNATGQGEMRFLDRIVVGLHQATEVRLSEVRQEADDTVSMNVYQDYGNTHVQLSQQPNTWVTLRTDYVTVTNLEQGADFIICHKPEVVTCGVVLKGVVAFVAEGKREIAKQGEAIYVKPGQPPSAPICIQEADVMDWLQKVQTSEPVKGLGAIVAGWPQEPCSAVVQGSATSEASQLPSSENMVRIEAGVYTIGGPQADDFHVAQQQTQLSQYWIDQYELTNARYQEFIDATGHQPPTVWPGQEDHPVRGVTWDDAVAYCTWADKRLPTEAEWEAAARGPGSDPRLYPWGNDPQAGGQVFELPLDGTHAVGSFAFNQSPSGVYDLAGNVWEWVGEPYINIPEGMRVLRGGRFGLIWDAAYRQIAEPDHERFVPLAGFRCAADRVQGE